MEAQCIIWRKLNTTITKKGVTNPKFKGLMANNAQANWNVVYIVTRDLIVKMINKERTNLSIGLNH
jgi:hypothetical protein